MKWKFNISETKTSVLGSTIASLGAILASSCCIIPVVFFNLGIGGAWLGNLAILQPYRIHFIGIAILMFAVGLFLFIRGQTKKEGECSLEEGKRIKRIPVMLGVSAVLFIAAIIWPEVEPHLLRAIR